MSDGELLEKAAKAAGMFVLPEPWPNKSGWFFCLQHGLPAMHYRDLSSSRHQTAAWAPLTDDGDALRLAVKLRIDVAFDPSGFAVGAQASSNRECDGCERLDGEDAAATRRAIVRAAAAMAGAAVSAAA